MELYLELFERLSRRARWKITRDQQCVIASILATVPLDDPFGTLEEAASVLRNRSGWFGPLTSPVRWVVAAMLLRRGLPPGRVHERVVGHLAALKKRGLPWGGTGRTLAAVLLALASDPDDATETHDRIERIHRLWKADHPHITGDDDLPMGALHAMRDEAPGALSDRIEDIYRELHRGGFPRGNALQLSTQILGVYPWSAGEAAGRFHAIRDAFVDRGEKIRRGRFDEVALLSLAPGIPFEIVESVLDDRDRLRSVKPRPWKEISFSIATGLHLARCEAVAGEGLPSFQELSAIEQVRAALQAQQAALAGVFVSSVATSSG